jgi:acetyl esterase/lipase
MLHRSLVAGFVGLILYAALGGASGFGQLFNGLPEPESYGGAIEMRADIAFGESDQQKFDFFLPAGVRPAPVVVCWFGGAFWGSSRAQLRDLAAFFAAHGFAAVTPGYFLGTRDGSGASWPYAIYDAKAAVRFVRANAKDLGVDPDQIVALGYSSGAYLAMMVGFTPNLRELEGSGVALSESSKVSAVIEIAGVCDRRRTVGLPLALLGRGFEDKFDLRVASSPIIYVSPNTVPVYILHGKQDHVSDVSSATQLAAALEAAHVAHELHLVDADHYPFSSDELLPMVEWLNKILQVGTPRNRPALQKPPNPDQPPVPTRGNGP